MDAARSRSSAPALDEALLAQSPSLLHAAASLSSLSLLAP
jgi:hypothetical protein